MDSKKAREIPGYIRPYFDGASHIQYYRECEKSNRFSRDIEDRFVCLKGFSSSTPVINAAAFGRKCLGGGFYFRYGGLGIAVDPGIGFTSLMHDYNIYISDIDAVIVTHPHLDHNCDVRMLSALLHDYNAGKARDRRFFEEFFDCNDDKPRRITWYMDEETIASTKEILRGQSVYPLSACCAGPVELGDGVALSAVRTRHIKRDDGTYSDQTYGIRLRFGEGPSAREWGYTSDTRFFEELGAFFRNLQVLIFNISDAYRTDVEKGREQSGHLGFSGSEQLLRAAGPAVALASEFRCTNGDYRYEIVKALRKESEARILPANPGLIMDIAGERAKCSQCGRDAEAGRIKAAHPGMEYGDIRYICPDCLL